MIKSDFRRAGYWARAALLAGTAFTVQPAFAQQGIEDIVVTAQKREQNLQDVPISITALSSEALVANRIQDVRDLNAIAPNLTVRLSSGGGQLPNFTLRGILTSGSAAGTDKGVALYLDGVYIQSVIGSVFDFADIERIEVLKGPQGTLFGRNATGGAISVITRGPSGEFGIKQDLTYGNYDQFRSKTRVDLPSWGPFSASITYLHSERRGDTRNLGAGTVLDYGPATNGRMGKRVSPEWLGSDNVEAVAAAVKADLGDFQATYKFDYSENNYTPNAQGTNYLPAGFVRSLYEASPNEMTPVTSKRPKAVNNAFTTPSRLWSYGHNLTATYRVSDEVTFKNILAYRKSSLTSSFQLDGVGGLVNSFGLGGAPTDAPFIFLANNTYNREHQWSNEFQINVATDWFQLTAGYLHFTNTIVTGGAPGIFNTLISKPIYGQDTSSPGTPFVIPGNPGFISNRVKSTSDAVFVQPEFHITDQIDLVAGARLTKDRKSGYEVAPDQAVARPGPGTNTISSPIRYRDSQVNFMLGVNYRPNNDLLFYAKYADGYISGGQIATIAFDPEYAYSYEAGVKADMFDRRWRSNLAAFYVDYKGIQYTTSGTLTGVPSSYNYGQAVIASADARAYGFEWENTIVPVDGITLTANVGYTNFKFDQDTVFGGPNANGMGYCRGRSCTGGFVLQSGAAGYQEFQRPKWTGTLAAQYDSPEVFAGGHITLRADANFRSKTLMTSDLSEGNTLGELPSQAIIDSATVGFQWLVNARAGLVGMQLGRSTVDIGIWGKNILNNRNIVQYSNLGPVAGVIYERAPTYGLDVSFTM